MMNILKAKDGFRLYDGSTIATEVALAYNADPSIWKEITEDEANRILKEKELEYYRAKENERIS